MIASSSPKLTWLAPSRLHPNIHQPRQFFDEAQLMDLANSIAEHGILQPILCDTSHQIIAGERRWRAAQWLGLPEVPCMVCDVDIHQKAVMALLENIQRAEIEPLEQALAFKRLQDEFSWTHEHIAKMMGKSRVYVTNMMRLLKLSPLIQEALAAQTLTYGHAKVLVGLDEAEQQEFLKHLQQHPCSVRQLEKLVALAKKKQAPQLQQGDLYLSDDTHFIREMSLQMGTEVSLDYHENGSGWLKFKFFDHDTLSGLLQRLGLSYD